MKPVLIITHLPDRQDGIVRQSLHDAGRAVIERNPGDAEPLPAAGEVGGVVTLGGRQSATRVAEDPFLVAEVRLLQSALDQGVPVLGMCLGAQLLAVAAGGAVTYSGHMNAGWPELRTLPAAAEDPLFAAFPERLPVLAWHEDIIEMPPQATELAVTPGPGAALFRVGDSAWGSQAHLELTPAMLIEGWTVDPADIVEIEGAGHRIDDFRAQSRDHLVAQMAAARPMFTAFGRLPTSSLSSSAA
ncbi:MAG TPA: type 1 glutamine amidotransferase [Solirubrobacteraceae bacterium]|nr:type 1 glutamine amidotransferase [Solirubrobacteraceae bacterium]